jgi:hypothetical protein
MFSTSTVAANSLASRMVRKTVLDGCVVDVDQKITRWPDRYIDPDGLKMWTKVQKILTTLERDDDSS